MKASLLEMQAINDSLQRDVERQRLYRFETYIPVTVTPLSLSVFVSVSRCVLTYMYE